METFEFYERMKPYIERAAENAKRHARKTQRNAHILWLVYQQEKSRLHFATWDFKNNETVKVDRWSEPMTRDEFEEYLLNLAVWVEEFEEDDPDYGK